MEDLKHVKDNPRYDVSFHPAFASSCVIEHKNGEKHMLYEQDKSKPVDCSKGHPKKHVIKLAGKNGSKRDITVTIEDPNHDLAGITFSLYDEARDPTVAKEFDTTESFTVMNNALTCPPHCDPTQPPV